MEVQEYVYSLSFLWSVWKEKNNTTSKNTLAGTILNNFRKPHTKCLDDKKTDVNEDNKLKQTNDVYKNKTTN